MEIQPFRVEKLVKAWFVERPNRFTLVCRLHGGELVRAFLPNPGRLWEILLPDAPVYLVRESARGSRRLAYTAVAAERDGQVILLHTHWTNAVARRLIEEGVVPEFRGARIIGTEVKVGRSRFDLLLERGRCQWLVEVKSVTLFHRQVAMFPDAVTSRGRRHLEELARLRRRNLRTAVLFVVNAPQVRYFAPDYHTDYEFARTFLAVRKRVHFVAVPLEWTSTLTARVQRQLCEVPWRALRRECIDRGSCLVAVPTKCGRWLVTAVAVGEKLSTWLRRGARADGLRLPAEATGKPLLLPIRGSVPCTESLRRGLERLFDAATAPSWYVTPDHPLRIPALIDLLLDHRFLPISSGG